MDQTPPQPSHSINREPAQSSRPVAWADAIARWAEAPRAGRNAVLIVIAFVGAISAIRLAASPFLEIDEAQFVGHVDVRLVYANSHPPLYNWLVRALLELFGWHWAWALAALRALLLGATLLMVFDAARRFGGTAAGFLALACAALSPQVSWMSAHTLAHSLLAMTASAGVLHALALVATRGRPLGLVMMAVWAGIGILAKYNVALLIGPLAISIATEPTIRTTFARQWRALIAAALVFASFCAIALAGVLKAPAEATARLSKLYREGPFSNLDLPHVGVDGFLSLTLAVVAWGGISLVLIGIAASSGRLVASPAMRVLGRTLALGLGGFAAYVLIADASAVHERYLTPLLMTLPILAGLCLAPVRWRGVVIAAGLVAFAAVPIGMIGMIAFDKHRYARPYAALAAPIAAVANAEPIEVRSSDPALAANMTLALQRHGRGAFVAGDPLAEAPPQTIALIQPAGWPLKNQPTQEWCRGETLDLAAPYNNLSGRTMAATAVLYRPCADR